MPRTPTLDDLRRYAVHRAFPRPVALGPAIERLGFVQADPIRAPARAQDLTLRHRVAGYRAGGLEQAYGALEVEEDFFVNYGVLARGVQALMHPRVPPGRRLTKREQAIADFVRDRGDVHPRDVHRHFAHGTVTNYWGGASNATTHLLDGLHFRGVLRVARREHGIRVYAVRSRDAAPAGAADRRERLDALVDVIVGTYAPLPGPSLSALVRRLRYGVPQWRGEIEHALDRARRRLAHARVGGVDWYWPAGDRTAADATSHDIVRLLAPFDPLVWDRRRFELFWSWAYRFEAYTPAPKRKLGYYALPLLWRDRVVGWGNLTWRDGDLQASFGYVAEKPPAGPVFRRELDAELERVRRFLG